MQNATEERMPAPSETTDTAAGNALLTTHWVDITAQVRSDRNIDER